MGETVQNQIKIRRRLRHTSHRRHPRRHLSQDWEQAGERKRGEKIGTLPTHLGCHLPVRWHHNKLKTASCVSKWDRVNSSSLAETTGKAGYTNQRATSNESNPVHPSTSNKPKQAQQQ